MVIYRGFVKLFIILIISNFIFTGFQILSPTEPVISNAGANSTFVSGSYLNGISENANVYKVGLNTEITLDLKEEWVKQAPLNHPDLDFDDIFYQGKSSVWGDDKVVVFLGKRSAVIGEGPYFNYTWTYDLSDDTWTKKDQVIQPPPRYSAHISPVYGTDQIVLFGGASSITTYHTDIWIYDVSDGIWSPRYPAEKPLPREYSNMAYIYGEDKVMIFDSVFHSDLTRNWFYDLSDNTWTSKSHSTGPGYRDSPVIAPIYGDDRIVLFGGWHEATSTPVGGTWVYYYKTNYWKEMKPDLEPEPRRYHVMNCIFNSNKIYLEGGSGQTSYDDFWIYDYPTNKWEKQNPFLKPNFYSTIHAPIYSSTKIMMYLWEPYNDTWLYGSHVDSGTFTISPQLGEHPYNFKSMSWKADTPPGTSIKLQLRTGKTAGELVPKSFSGPDGTSSTYYTDNPSTIWSGHYGDHWLQYKVYLSTEDSLVSPLFDELTFELNVLASSDWYIPGNGSMINTARPLFQWNFTDIDSIVQDSFQVLIDDDRYFTSVDYDSGEVKTSSNEWQFPAGTSYDKLPQGIWYWKVRLKDSDGDWGLYSDPQRIHVDTELPKSTVTNPLNGSFHLSIDDITGTSIDNEGGSGVVRVEISIKNHNDGLYWNGTDWEPTITWFNAKGIDSWSFNAKSVNWKNQVKYNVLIRAVDGAGNFEIPPDVVVTIDRDYPRSTLITPADGSMTNNLDNITITASDGEGSGVAKVEVSIEKAMDGTYWDGTDWIDDEVYFNTTGSGPWYLDGTSVGWISDNDYIIHSRAEDRLGNVESRSIGSSIYYDCLPPEDNSLVIEDGRDYTTTREVKLTLKSVDTGSGVDMMSFRTEGDVWSNWEGYTTTKTLILPAGDGVKEVNYRTIDKAGNIAEGVLDTIILDTTPPEALSIEINGGAEKTDSTEVILTISTADNLTGVDQIAFSPDGLTWDPWKDYSETYNYSLDPGDGIKFVYFKVKDKAGNEGVPVSAFIELNTSIVSDDPEKGDDGPDTKEERTEKKSENIPLFIIIASVILIIVIVAFSGYFISRKKKEMKEEAKDEDKEPESEGIFDSYTDPELPPTPTELEKAAIAEQLYGPRQPEIQDHPRPLEVQTQYTAQPVPPALPPDAVPQPITQPVPTGIITPEVVEEDQQNSAKDSIDVTKQQKPPNDLLGSG